jgi:hypothetical protein
MKVFKKALDFYVEGSIHVALSCFALVQITQHYFKIYNDYPIAYFSFFGAIVGYNFVKYEALARAQKAQMKNKLKAIAILSFLSLIAVGFYFFQLQKITQIISTAFFILTLLYALPFFPNKKNARNWAGVKIYIVALCWVGVTVVLPVLNAEVSLTSDFYLKCIQRFILIFVLILIFEIIDLAKDDPHLQTVPQQIGVKRTKQLGFLLLALFFGLNFFSFIIDVNFEYSSLIVAIVTAFFLAFANEKRFKYYTSFWAESVPILWWILLLIL